jgi:hypothetical protein
MGVQDGESCEGPESAGPVEVSGAESGPDASAGETGESAGESAAPGEAESLAGVESKPLASSPLASAKPSGPASSFGSLASLPPNPSNPKSRLHPVDPATAIARKTPCTRETGTI